MNVNRLLNLISLINILYIFNNTISLKFSSMYSKTIKNNPF